MSMLTGSYATGTASIASASTTVTIVGGLTTALVAGDPFYCGNCIGVINSITDNTHFELSLPWAGTTQSAAQYIVTYMSTQRYSSAFNGQKVRQLLTLLDGIGVIYYVPSTSSVPDPANGNDGDVALKIVPGSQWPFWVKQSGVWVNMGSPVGITWDGLWNSGTAYVANSIVTRLGVLYIAAGPTTGNAPESSPSYWQLLLQGGNLFPLAFDASDRPDSGDTFRRFCFPVPVTFYSGLTGSVANALIPATATAVISLQQNGTQFATLTFAAGATTGTFACATTTTFSAGGIFSMIAPNPRDATLATLAITVLGYR